MKKSAVLVVSMLALALAPCMVGCSQQSSAAEASPESIEQAADEATVTTDLSWDSLTSNSDSSLVATHPSAIPGELGTATCLSCHDYAALADDFESKPMNEGGKVVFNPHAGHVAFECTDCHSLTEDPVLRCNSCHYIDVPEGWYNSTDDGKAKYMDPDKIYGDMGYDVHGFSYNMDPDQEMKGAEFL